MPFSDAAEGSSGAFRPLFLPFLASLALAGPPAPVQKPKAAAPGRTPAKSALLRILKVGGEGGWDCVALDAKVQRL